LVQCNATSTTAAMARTLRLDNKFMAYLLRWLGGSSSAPAISNDCPDHSWTSITIIVV
jgi:hypothetical protein